jgi:hypothetical protein
MEGVNSYTENFPRSSNIFPDEDEILEPEASLLAHPVAEM